MSRAASIADRIRRAANGFAPTLDRGHSDPLVVAALRAADGIADGTVNYKGGRGGEPHAVLNAVRDLVGAYEESDLPETSVEYARRAHADACELLGFALGEDPHTRPLPVHQLAAHLADLIDFHRDDPDEVQHGDPILSVDRRVDGNGAALRITLESGQRFLAVLVAEPK